MVERAEVFARMLLELARAVPELEDADVLDVRTAEVVRAMGLEEGAPLEQVQAFAREVAARMEGHGISVVCGCGYLSLMVGPAELQEQAFAEGRELRSFEPDDLVAYYRELPQIFKTVARLSTSK
jgi:hypothetical protein